MRAFRRTAIIAGKLGAWNLTAASGGGFHAAVRVEADNLRRPEHLCRSVALSAREGLRIIGIAAPKQPLSSTRLWPGLTVQSRSRKRPLGEIAARHSIWVSGGLVQISVCSDISNASSTSMPR